VKVTPSLIHQATLDDALFAEPPSLAATADARNDVADRRDQADSRRADLLHTMFAVAPYPALLIDGAGRVRLTNHAADAALRIARFIRLHGGHLRTACDSSRNEFDRALAIAADPQRPRISSCLLRATDGGFQRASLTPLLAPLLEPAVLITLDAARPAEGSSDSARNAQRAYGLSPSEADIAVRLANGATIQEISDQRGSTVGTVRTQVKHIFSKMHARRQSDVVRLMAALGPPRVPDRS
jgi:DNA-binding CsgD family transcriptional regulator